MLKFKTLTVITFTTSLCVLASQASAQTNQPMLETAQPILSQSSLTVKTVESEDKIMPRGMSARKVKRVVKPVPQQASTSQLRQRSVYSGVIHAGASKENTQTRFIYSKHKDDAKMPVYFNEESLTSK